jgi:hypothetical protein
MSVPEALPESIEDSGVSGFQSEYASFISFYKLGIDSITPWINIAAD